MKRDRNYLKNRNATKNPKVFNLTLFRDELGRFHSVGGETLMLDRRSNEWVNVNTRDLAREINQIGICE
jgi:hypothetical protein